FEVVRGDPADTGSNNAGTAVTASTPRRNPNDDDRIPPDKLALQRQHEKEQQDALLSPIPTKKDPAEIVYPYETPEPWPSGNFEHAHGPFPAIAFSSRYGWQDVVDGAHMQVFAGADGQDASQGLV